MVTDNESVAKQYGQSGFSKSMPKLLQKISVVNQIFLMAYTWNGH